MLISFNNLCLIDEINKLLNQIFYPIINIDWTKFVNVDIYFILGGRFGGRSGAGSGSRGNSSRGGASRGIGSRGSGGRDSGDRGRFDRNSSGGGGDRGKWSGNSSKN